MCTMELIEEVKKVQSILRCHDRAVSNILNMDRYIRRINMQSLNCAMQGRFDRVMALLMHKSVAEGVKRMLKIYRLRKWFSAQTIIHRLCLRYRWNTGMRLLANMDLAYSRPDIVNIAVEDNAAPTWIVMETEFYRND